MGAAVCSIPELCVHILLIASIALATLTAKDVIDWLPELTFAPLTQLIVGDVAEWVDSYFYHIYIVIRSRTTDPFIYTVHFTHYDVLSFQLPLSLTHATARNFPPICRII